MVRLSNGFAVNSAKEWLLAATLTMLFMGLDLMPQISSGAF
jgi:hypothetical protein